MENGKDKEMRTTIVFDEVKRHAAKSGKCTICGKRRTRKKTFCQTLNPYNKNADGTIKTTYQIQQELQAQTATWEQEPINCCEDK